VTVKALDVIKADPLLPARAMVGGYANGFMTAKSGTGEYRDLSPDDYWNIFASRLVNHAAPTALEPRGVVVGGCCGIFPQHIQRIREGIDEIELGEKFNVLSSVASGMATSENRVYA
jgi:S-methylmethionine-dependent homocysteine/selenocysteine methylase